MARLLLVDGHSLIHRAFFALPTLSADGVPTGAVYGFLNMLFKLLDREDPDELLIIFDTPAPTFRHERFEEYKAQRPGTPDELVVQLALLREILEAMGMAMLAIDGYEADDLIGTVAQERGAQEHDVVIVTGDRDVLQLLAPGVRVLLTKRGIQEMDEYNPQRLEEQYGLTPKQFIDLKGLMGDSSDNIPGVPGIGEKRALALLKSFESIEGALANIDAITPPSVRKSLLEYGEQAKLSRELATIKCDVPLQPGALPDKVMDPDWDRVRELFERYQFKSLMERLGLSVTVSSEEIPLAARLDARGLVDYWNEARASGTLALYDWAGKRGGGSLLAMSHGGSSTVYADLEETMPAAIAQELSALSEAGVELLFHSAKPWVGQAVREGKTLTPVFDVSLAYYLLHPTRASYPLSEATREYLGEELPPLPAPKGKKVASKDEVVRHLSAGVAKLTSLRDSMSQKLAEQEMEQLYQEVELPLQGVLADMEANGIEVDQERAQVLSEEFGSTISRLEEEIFWLAGRRFNINSTRQLAQVLFEELGLPAKKRTKTGFSTDAEVLESLADQHDIAQRLLEYRQMVKLKGTYLDGLSDLIHPDTGRLHTTFNQTVAATGRLSSTEPNLQNIPVRMEKGRMIRSVFRAREGMLLLAGDYSQIELRILAHLAHAQSLIDAFSRGEDIHARTAAEVFGTSLDEVDPLLRSRAKAVNFGIVYGISDWGLSRDLGVSRKEAAAYMERYFQRYPEIKAYMETTIAFARRHQYVTTIMGRRRPVPEIKSRNPAIRGAQERIAINTPVQGSAADIIKKAMVRVYQQLRAHRLKACMLLQVHDELILEVPTGEIDEVARLLQECMEDVVALQTPLRVDLKQGATWYDLKPMRREGN